MNQPNHTLVEPRELTDLIESRSGVILDCRFALGDASAGQRSYAEGHIPGAIHADLERHLSGPALPGQTGRHPLPAKSEFLGRLRDWGIGEATLVIAYDDAGGPFAARAWWLLRWCGHHRVAVLDGGWQAWLAAGGTVDRIEHQGVARPGPPPSSAVPLTNEVTAADLLEGSHLMIDARDRERFDGIIEPIDPVAGHIPGAICMPFLENLQPDLSFKPAAELRSRFASLAEQSRPSVCYCGSGVTATHNILAFVHAGLPEPALYPGSWSEWITDPDRPVEP